MKGVGSRSLRRSRSVLVTCLGCLLLVEARLVQVQLVKSGELARYVVDDRTEPLAAQRGAIRDRHELPLAVSTLSARPERDLVARGPYDRVYPFGDAAAMVTGIVGRSFPRGFVGREGIERGYESILGGTDGQVRYIVTGSGQFCKFEPLRIDRLPEPGMSVSLTIDALYQGLAYAEAEALRARVGARWTGILIMRPSTGEILAAATSPSVDPGRFPAEATTTNPLWTKQFEPGSSFKIVVLAAALEEGLVTPESTIDCENGRWVTPARTWHDTSPLGVVDLRTAVAKSSNIAAAKLGVQLEAHEFVAWAKRFGFGVVTSAHLDAEVPGYLPEPGPHQRSVVGAMAIGQGVSVTAVQLLNAFCCIANGGVLMQPLLAKANGVVEPTTVHRVMAPSTAATLTELLRGVVERGTGTAARHPRVAVAGKTGTALCTRTGGVGYLRGTYVATFAGFFPAEAPEVAILVVASEPKKGFYGGSICAPVFRRLTDLMIGAPGGCLYPALAAVLSAAPRCGWVRAASETVHG